MLHHVFLYQVRWVATVIEVLLPAINVIAGRDVSLLL